MIFCNHFTRNNNFDVFIPMNDFEQLQKNRQKIKFYSFNKLDDQVFLFFYKTYVTSATVNELY